MEQEKKNLMSIIVLMLTFFILLNIFDWVRVNNLSDSVNPIYLRGVAFFERLNNKLIWIRVGYIVLIIASAFLLPKWRIGQKPLDNNDKIILSLLSVSLSAFVIYGFSKNGIYNLVIYPLFFLGVIPVLTRLITNFKSRPVDEDFFKGITNQESEFKFDFETQAGLLTEHSPEQGTFIDGGPGSGKSHYLIKFILRDIALYQYAGFVYDYEGDPTMKDSPILSKIVLSAIKQQRQLNKDYKLKSAFINFTDPTKTERVNLLSERYYNENNAQLFIYNLASTLMKNLQPTWKEKTDFWADNAINYVFSVMYLLYKNHREEGLNTIPHAISICLEDSDLVFRWISEDMEVSKMMASMLTAWKLGAQQQTAGAVSSAQLPLIKLFKRNIYWVLSKDAFNLDITNPENPTLLCVGNSPQLKEALSPAISCIASIVMNQMNSSGKVKGVFVVDELPTINLFGLDNFLNTVRKHKVATVLAVQDFNQLIRDYGKDSANIIRTGCGNYFQGMTSNYDTASSVVKMLGEIKKTNISFSKQESGGGSMSESLQKEKVLQEREITSQKAGHFFVKIANGEPPFAFTQFEPFHTKNNIKIEEVPMNLIADVGDDEKNKYLMNCVVEANFQRINKEAKALLEKYIPDNGNS